MLRRMTTILFLTFFCLEAFADNALPITIGAIYNLNGRQSTLDTYSADGAKLAVKEINADGGVLGKSVQLIIDDGKTDPNTITKIAENFGENQAMVAVIGLSDTDMAVAAIPALAAHKKIFITSGATSPELPAMAPGWVFLACFGDNEQAQRAAEFSYHALHGKTALLVTQQDSRYAQLLTQYFQQRYVQLGGKISKQVTFIAKDADISSQLNAIQQNQINPDIIYVAAGPVMSVKIIKQLRQSGFRQPIIGGDSLDSDQLAKQPPQQLGDIYFTTHAFIAKNNPDPRIQKFIAAYQREYHRMPDSSFSGLGYDTVYLLVQAIRDAQSTDPVKIRAALLKIHHFQGVTGVIDYSDYIPNKSITIIHFHDGQRSLVMFQPSA